MKYNLSEIIALIKDRRTIYPEAFSTRKVQREQIELLLNAAIWAPTHGNTQPWRFTVFTDTALESLADFLGKTYLETVPAEKQDDRKLAKLITRPKMASAIIAVSMKRDEAGRISELEEVEAVAAAIQNILLAATAYGLGSFWATPGIIYTQQMNAFLELDPNDKCLGLIYLGYTKDEWPKGQRKPIEYITSWRTGETK